MSDWDTPLPSIVTLSNRLVSEWEQPTCALRWQRRGSGLVLQQAWLISEHREMSLTTTRTEWRDVPIEDAA